MNDEKAAAASLLFRERSPDIIHDVYYDRLMADPIGTVRGIYDCFGLAWSDTYEEQLNAYVRDNPQGKHGMHQYSSEDFGLTDEAISRRFAGYCERFGLAP